MMFKAKRIRLGLCCKFNGVDIRFTSRKAGALMKLSRNEQLDRLSTTIVHNARSLLMALEYCAENGIGSFRVGSDFLPLKSHPQLQYQLGELPEWSLIDDLLAACRSFAASRNLRLTFHPDQFTLLSSPRERVIRQSVAELDYHAELAERIGADVITLHGGGGYGDKASALARLEANIEKLPATIRSRLALENDDRIYCPRDLLPVCRRTGVPLVYDVHHHRCLPDEFSEQETTRLALATWNREPLFHLSSPRDGWQARDIRPHHDFIDPADLPSCWRDLEVTIEVEAKAKELAVDRLRRQLMHAQGTGAGSKKNAGGSAETRSYGRRPEPSGRRSRGRR